MDTRRRLANFIKPKFLFSREEFQLSSTNARRVQTYLYRLSIFRIAIGLLNIAYLYTIFDDRLYLYGRYGLIDGEINALLKPSYIPNVTDASDWLLHAGLVATEPAAIDVLLALNLFFSVLLTVGFFTRVSALATWLLTLLFLNTTLLLSYGFDALLSNCLFFCVILPTTRLSLDARISNVDEQEKFSVFSIWFLRVFLSIIYFFSGLNKLGGTDWWNGDAIWKVANLPPLSQMPLQDLVYFSPIFPLFSISVLMLETLYPLNLFFPRLRIFWIPAMIMMHVGIAVVMNLILFAAVMVILNLCAFESLNLANDFCNWSPLPRTHKKQRF